MVYFQRATRISGSICESESMVAEIAEPPTEKDFVQYMSQFLVSLGCRSRHPRLILPGSEHKFFTSCFVIEVAKDLYLVTAAHVFKEIQQHLRSNPNLLHEFVLFFGFGRFSVRREPITFPY